KHRKQLLGFALCENGNEHASAACESTVDPFGQALFLPGPRPICRFGVIASRAFHNQDVDLLLREDCPFHDRLIVEIDVTRVEDRSAFGAQENPSRAKDMPCIKKLECQCVGLSVWGTFARDREGVPQRTPMPKLRSVV